MYSSRLITNSKSNVMKPTPTINRTRCNARICATLCVDEKCFFGKVLVEHNHCVSPDTTMFFRCNKNIDATMKRRLKLIDKAGIRTNKFF
jgi:hypothetical protein